MKEGRKGRWRKEQKQTDKADFYCLIEIKDCDCCNSKMCMFLGKVKRHKGKYSKFNEIPSEKSSSN